MRKYGLIGFPLEHSFSKTYFEDKFEKENIKDVEYLNFPLEKIEDFEVVCKGDPLLRGFNVTIPYKESIIKYLDALNDEARATQAVNTICYCKKSDHKALVGHNTDVTGFRQSLKEHITEAPKKAMILGTGGSSKAVKYVLEEMNTEIIMVSSSGKEQALAYGDLSKELMESLSLIVNTTPLGMYPKVDQYPDIPYEYLDERHLLFDLIYNPEETEFLRRGKEKKANTVNGKDMLVYQAEAAWDIWNRNK